MILCVCGSRDFTDYEHARRVLDKVTSKTAEPITVLSGAARGADRLGERWAAERGHKVDRYPADWDRHGKRAGYLRNKRMIDRATHVVAFWDGDSKGTYHSIDLAQQRGIPCRVVDIIA